jgi:drug/metabolite transporter (DMT)-like permease
MTSLKNLLVAAAKAGAVAAFINAVLFFVFKASGIITDDILLEPAKEPMTVVPVIISSLVPSLLSAFVLYILLRYFKKGFLIFMVVAIVLLIVSFGNPFFGIPNVTVPYAIALDIMHIVVALSVLYFYRAEVRSANSTAEATASR